MNPKFKVGDQFIDTETPHKGIFTVTKILTDVRCYVVRSSMTGFDGYTRDIDDPALRELTKLERVLA